MSRLLLLLGLAVALTSHGQTLSAPFFLDTPAQGPGGGDQLRPDVTWTGTEFLVVWDDARSGQGSDVWVATVDAHGATVLANRALFTAAGNQRSASVSMGNGAALVTWLDEGPCGAEVMAAVVTPSLSLVGSPVQVSTGACTSNRPSVAWSAADSTWLVAWGEHGSGRDLKLRFVSSSGVPGVESTVFAPNTASNPRLVAAGSGFVVAWQTDAMTAGVPAVQLMLVSSSMVGAPVLVAPSALAQTNPVVAASVGGLGIVWREGGALRFKRFDLSLTLAGMTQTIAPGDQPAMAWLGTASDFFVTFEAPDNSGTGLFGWSTAAPLPFRIIPREGYFDRHSARVASGGGALAVLATGPTGYVSGQDVIAQTLDLATVGLSDAGVQRVSAGIASVRDVRGAFDGSRYLTVWRDEGRSVAGSDSMGQLLAPETGALVGPDAGLRFSVGSANLASFPEVAGGDGGFFVTWGDDGSGGALVGLNVSSSGARQPTRVLSDQSSYVNTHASVFSGQGYLTVSLKNGALRARLTSTASVALQSETFVFNTGAAPERVQVARMDEVSFAVFLARDGGVDVQGARFGPDASVLDATPVVVSALPGDEADCTVAAGPTGFLVGFTSVTDAGREVFLSRVSASGVVRDVPALRVGVGTQPSLGWTGSSWLVTWRASDDIVAARFDANGQRIGSAPIAVAASALIERSPDVTVGPAGEALITWDGYSPMDQNFRAFGRLFTEPAIDAGLAVDAGGESTDAGANETDAGPDDAGTNDPDAGADAGLVTPEQGDGGREVPSMRHLAVGCSAVPAPWLLFAALLVLSASRSRRTPSSG